MADLDKLRALLVLLREFGVTRYSAPVSSGVNFPAAELLTIELAPAHAAPAKIERPRPEDPAVATVRKLQELLPGGVDLG